MSTPIHGQPIPIPGQPSPIQELSEQPDVSQLAKFGSPVTPKDIKVNNNQDLIFDGTDATQADAEFMNSLLALEELTPMPVIDQAPAEQDQQVQQRVISSPVDAQRSPEQVQINRNPEPEQKVQLDAIPRSAIDRSPPDPQSAVAQSLSLQGQQIRPDQDNLQAKPISRTPKVNFVSRGMKVADGTFQVRNFIYNAQSQQIEVDAVHKPLHEIQDVGDVHGHLKKSGEWRLAPQHMQAYEAFRQDLANRGIDISKLRTVLKIDGQVVQGNIRFRGVLSPAQINNIMKNARMPTPNDVAEKLTETHAVHIAHSGTMERDRRERMRDNQLAAARLTQMEQKDAEEASEEEAEQLQQHLREARERAHDLEHFEETELEHTETEELHANDVTEAQEQDQTRVHEEETTPQPLDGEDHQT